MIIGNHRYCPSFVCLTKESRSLGGFASPFYRLLAMMLEGVAVQVSDTTGAASSTSVRHQNITCQPPNQGFTM